jgi:hypothetical protein
MKTTICDGCKVNLVEVNYHIQVWKYTHQATRNGDGVIHRMDLCEQCYRKLMNKECFK